MVNEGCITPIRQIEENFFELYLYTNDNVSVEWLLGRLIRVKLNELKPIQILMALFLTVSTEKHIYFNFNIEIQSIFLCLEYA